MGKFLLFFDPKPFTFEHKYPPQSFPNAFLFKTVEDGENEVLVDACWGT